MGKECIVETIVNSCWAALLKHGLPMTKSIWAYEWDENGRSHLIILNMNKTEEIIYTNGISSLPPQLKEKSKQHKELLLESVNQCI
jgi:hypothetical protein